MSEPATELVLRACCSAPGAAAAFVEEAAGEPVLATGDVTEIAVEQGERSLVDAYHEAAHAAAAHVCGVGVQFITVDPPNPLVRYREGLKGLARAVVSLAGPAGGFLACRREHRDYDEVVVETFRRVAGCWPGRCDYCQAMRECVVLARLDEKRAIELYREAESAAWRLLMEPPVRRLIRLTADRLLAEGTMVGDDFQALAAEIVDPETLKELRSLIEMEN